MKYKILLTGKNQVIIDDFFYTMSEEFECVTTSIRSEDILNHIRYFQPDALVYCITAETRENITKLVTALSVIDNKNLKVILIGDSEACEEFTQLKPELVSLTLLKPITASIIRQQIVKLLDERRISQKMENERPEAVSVSEMKHILVIDDDPRMLRLIKAELKDEYNVATAVNGKAGLNFLQRKSTDLILLDYEMPEENGPEVLEKIRNNEDLKDIPVVFLTGINEREKIKKVLALKPQGYLLKPIEHDKLVQIIRQVIG